MIGFDGIAGNNDRHFYNWGVIDNTKRNRKTPKLAPLYDSARGLMWNFSDENIVNTHKVHNEGGKRLVNYVEKACPRISLEDNKDANHFELIDRVKKDKDSYRRIIDELANKEREERVVQMLKKEFYPFFIPERCELIEMLLRIRFERIRSI